MKIYQTIYALLYVLCKVVYIIWNRDSRHDTNRVPIGPRILELPEFKSRKSPDILDVFVSKIPNHRFNASTENLSNPPTRTTHSSITRHPSTNEKKTNPSPINGITNWEKFQSTISNDVNSEHKLKIPKTN